MTPKLNDIAAFGMLLFFALIMANGWPTTDWSLIWSFVGAVATIVTGVYAIKIAVTQKKWIDNQHEINKDRVRNEFRFIFSQVYIGLNLDYKNQKESMVKEIDEYFKTKNIEYLIVKRSELKEFYKVEHLNLFGNEAVHLTNKIVNEVDLLSLRKDLKDVLGDGFGAVFGMSNDEMLGLVIDDIERLRTLLEIPKGDFVFSKD